MKHPSTWDTSAPAPSIPNDPNSMLHWWPLVKDLAVPMPETIVVPSSYEALYGLLDGHDLPAETWAAIRAAADSLGYPVFMRTDHSSAKHDYLDTCYVPDPSTLEAHVGRLVEANALADFMGLPCSAIVLRKFIPLASRFAAFSGDLPIAPERRYFVSNGQPVCHHPYWPAAAIAGGCACDVEPCPSLPMYWRDTLTEMNTETDDEVALLSGYAGLIGSALPGYWSVDFALADDGRWIFIDAALGRQSWHPAECPHA